MANTTPNKETIRRICLLHGGTECHILVDTGDDYVDVLSNIENHKIEHCLLELKDWCGMKFQLFNNNSNIDEINRIRNKGVQILPINTI